MALLVFNCSGVPVTLTGLPEVVVVPASASPPSKGDAVNVTSELRGLTSLQYVVLDAQRVGASLLYQWTSEPEYSTSSLVTGGVSSAGGVSYDDTLVPSPSIGATTVQGAVDYIKVHGSGGIWTEHYSFLEGLKGHKRRLEWTTNNWQSQFVLFVTLQAFA